MIDVETMGVIGGLAIVLAELRADRSARSRDTDRTIDAIDGIRADLRAHALGAPLEPLPSRQERRKPTRTKAAPTTESSPGAHPAQPGAKSAT